MPRTVTDIPIRRLLGETHRRCIFQTAALYIVGTWLVMQVADVVFPAMDIEERAILNHLRESLGIAPADAHALERDLENTKY